MSFCQNCGAPSTPGVPCAKCGIVAAAPAAPMPVFGAAPAQGGFAAPSYAPGPQPGFQPLPDPSPMALILAAVGWTFCGPITSLPAVIIARGDMRGIREGRLNPNGMAMSQIAFWAGLINCGIYALIVLFVGLMFLIGMGAALSSPRSHHFTAPVAPATVKGATRAYEAVETEIEAKMAVRPEADRKLWRQAKDDLRMIRKKTATGPMPEAKGLAALLASVSGERALWSSLVELEKVAAQESGHDVPTRVQAAEAVEHE